MRTNVMITPTATISSTFCREAKLSESQSTAHFNITTYC